MLNRLFNRALIALAVGAAGVIIFVMVSVDFEVVMRYVFNSPTRWVQDFTEYALLFILFLATGWVLFEEAHVRVDIVLSHISPKSQRILNTVTSIAGAVACAVLFWFSLRATWEAFAAGEIIRKALTVPRGAIWIIMPIGSLLLTIQFMRRAWSFARSLKEKGSDIGINPKTE